MITKFMGTQGYIWFIGEVEDNIDPQTLGRVRVRCFGFHTTNKEDLKTEHLPWATVVQPTTSGAFQGAGTSATGLLIGTRVIGFFADGVAAQYPIVTGSLGGINNGIPNAPGTANQPLSPRELEQRMTQENSGQGTADIPATIGAFGQLTGSQFDEYKAAIGQRESGGNYRIINQLGYIGKYQFGAAALHDTGYVNITSGNSRLAQDSVWKGKNGVISREVWYTNALAQEEAMQAFTAINYRSLITRGILSTSSTPRQVAGYLGIAQLLGAGGAATFYRTQRGSDANGVSGAVYYRIGYNSITDPAPRI